MGFRRRLRLRWTYERGARPMYAWTASGREGDRWRTRTRPAKASRKRPRELSKRSERPRRARSRVAAPARCALSRFLLEHLESLLPTARVRSTSSSWRRSRTGLSHSSCTRSKTPRRLPLVMTIIGTLARGSVAYHHACPRWVSLNGVLLRVLGLHNPQPDPMDRGCVVESPGVVALAAQWWPQLEDLRSHDGSLEPVAEHTQQHGDPLITDALLVVTPQTSHPWISVDVRTGRTGDGARLFRWHLSTTADLSWVMYAIRAGSALCAPRAGALEGTFCCLAKRIVLLGETPHTFIRAFVNESHLD
jgi:hypothetical protein